MGGENQGKWYAVNTWRRRAAIALALFLILLVLFHRPVLLTIGEHIVRHYAARAHLKADLRLEGNVFTSLTLRNVHVVSTGDNPIESIDVDFARFHYSLIELWRRGPEDFLRTAEVSVGRVVLDPAKAKLKKAPDPNEKIELPHIFPESIHLADVTLLIKDTPHNTLIEHLDLHLDPRNERNFRIERLQLAAGQKFEKITGQSSYGTRNLILKNIEIGGDHIQFLGFDASHIRQRLIDVKLESDLGGGQVSLSGSLRETTSSINTEVHLAATQVEASSLDKYIGQGSRLGGKIEKLDFNGTGLFNVPNTWNAELSARFAGLREHEFGVDTCSIQVSARDGQALLKSAEFVQGQNHFQAHGAGTLPHDVKDFGRVPAAVEISATAVDLARATAGLPQRLTGAAEVKGTINIQDSRLRADLSVTAGPVGFADGTLEKLTATVSASRPVTAADAKKPWFEGLRSSGALALQNVRFRDYAIDSVEGTAQSADALLKVDELRVKRAGNELSLNGTSWLPADPENFEVQPAQVNFALNAPQLGDYWAVPSPDRVTGPLRAGGEVEWRNGLGNGEVTVYGADLKMRDLVFHTLSSQCSLADSVVYLNDFTAALNERDFISANGRFDLRGVHAYGGRVSASIANLATLKPLLRASGNANELSGSLAMNWEGTGEVRTVHNSGKLNVSLEKGRYGNLQSLQARVDASYSPDGLNVPIIFLASNRMDFQASAQTRGETFEISKIQVDQGQAKYASGYISFPFIWKNLGTTAEVSPPKGQVVASFQSENIDLKRLFEDIGLKSQASGVLNLKLDAHGPLDQLVARLDLQARDLRTEKVPNLEPASIDLTAETRADQLNITGKLQQSKIQPMELTASLPFDAARVMTEHGLRPETPLTAKLRLPRSSVNFLRQFAPEIEQLDGDIALDVNLGGTIAKPVFSGAADMTVNVARSSNLTLPALRGFKARLNFANDALTVEQFGGDLSGGNFTLTGGARFSGLTNATLDLHLKADSVLVARNDTVTARTNADITIAGPFTSASVTGSVEMTNSQFLKNLDLIPIGLPGRPAPHPPSARPEFSFPDPPLRDWKFDVAIKTKDPFLIRGNLANGGAVSDLHLTGTGLHPGLQGIVRLENVEATLPFSRLEIAYGFLYFDPSDSLNPKLDLHGTSVIRDYTIHVYIYGTSLAPEALFTSEPPLPQEEVISLLATGSTREELAGNNNVLAGRAAMLLVQQLYRKVFKKGQGAQNSSVFDRLDLDVGQTDPRTGQQQATARFKVNDQFVLVGDLDVGGGFRGMVKYLIRFH